jgi:outer membrane receptor protein involved in Fe transport
MTGIESLSLDLRYRNSDYSTGFNVDTWNVGGEWTPFEGLMLRGGKSQAVRAPNILELFQPVNSGLWDGTDPCAGGTPLLTEAECANTGVLPGQYGSIPLSPAGQYNGIFGGNTTLGPETSDSITLGVVYSPERFLEGLSISVDYWSIDVQDAISTVDEEFTINQCATTNDAQFCNKINRGPNGNLWIGSANVIAQNINIGFLDVAGYDITGTYTTDIGNHGLDFNLRGTLVSKWDSQPVSGGDVNDCVGAWGGDCGRPKPEWKHTFNTIWTTPWNVQLIGTWRFIGETEEFATQRFKTDDTNYFDLAGNYFAEWLGGEVILNAGITNVTDEDPPANGFLGNIGTFGNGNTIPGQWDALGRYWFVGFTYSR